MRCPSSPSELLAGACAGPDSETTCLGATVQYLIQAHGGPLMKVCEINPQEVRPPSADETRAIAAMNDVVILRK